MQDPSHSLDLQQAWNGVSAAYNDGRPDFMSSITYGPLCPYDDELQLLGHVAGRAVLDIGCGGGQNAVCFAALGASVTALDFSERQLDHAKQTARESGVAIRFVLSSAETLSGISHESQYLVFCANVFPYIEQVEHALASCRRALKPGGRLVISMDHPFRTCFIDTESSDLTNYPERSYFAAEPRIWPFDGTGTLLKSFHRPIGQWIDLLRAAGIPLIRLLEPPVPQEVADDLFPADGPLASLRNIPHTLILVAGVAVD